MRTVVFAFCAVLICSTWVVAAAAEDSEKTTPLIDQESSTAAANVDEPVESVTKRPRLQFVTKAPEDEEVGYRTGKLDQFAGFVTPAPLPLNSMFLYSSVWAAWSAWSFCANGVRIRVRACNTIRGFSCYGTNKEQKQCEDPNDSSSTFSPQNPQLQPVIQLQPPVPQRPAIDSEYEATDPYNEDRALALKQLYGDYDEVASSTKTPPLSPLQSSANLPTIVQTTDFPDHEDFTNDISTQTVKLRQFTADGINSVGDQTDDGNQIGQVNRLAASIGNQQQVSALPAGRNSVGGLPIAIQPSDFSGSAEVLPPSPAPINTAAARASKNNCQQTPYYPYWICVTNVHQPQKSPFNIQASPLSQLQPSSPAPPAPPAHQAPSQRQPAIFDANSKETQVGAAPSERHMVHIDGKTYEIVVPSIHQEKSKEHQSSAIVAKMVDSANQLPTDSKIRGEGGVGKGGETTDDDDLVYETDLDEIRTVLASGKFEQPDEIDAGESTDLPDSEVDNSKSILRHLRPAVAVSVGGAKSHLDDEEVFTSPFGEELVEEDLDYLAEGNGATTRVVIKEPFTEAPTAIDGGLGNTARDPLAAATTEDGNIQPFTSSFSNLDVEYIDELEAAGVSSTKPLTTADFLIFTSPPIKPEERGFDKPSKAPHAFSFVTEAGNNPNPQAPKAAFTLDEDESKPANLRLVTITPGWTVPPPAPHEEDFAEWSRWSEWGACFCEKRARTRSCDYNSPYLTKGCVGKSYETKPCTGGTPCPDSGRHYIEPSTTAPPEPTFYTLAPKQPGSGSLPRVGYALQVHALSHAWRSRDGKLQSVDLIGTTKRPPPSVSDASLTGQGDQRRR
uniref:Uncharacterized protein n=1 Tax=Plectus sambesii TaxID=2011161 RepID=A0A914WGJ1_9BILA